MKIKHKHHNGIDFYYLESIREYNGVLTYDNERIVLKGKFYIQLMLNSYKFGNEIQFIIHSHKNNNKIKKEIRNPSDWNKLEICIPTTELKYIVDFIKTLKVENGES